VAETRIWKKTQEKQNDKLFPIRPLIEIWDWMASPSRFAVRKVIDDANNRTDIQKVIGMAICGTSSVR